MPTAGRPETDPQTSARLGRVRQANTKPELQVRQVLRGLGKGYTIRNRDLPGSPDIANRKRGWAIFVHGCFWHQHPGCRKATIPKQNAEFWAEKFAQNRLRDARQVAALAALGFSVIVVWECECRDRPALAARLESELNAR